jgi:hypothetical protein
MKAETTFARLSKAGCVLCGRRDEGGRFTCDGMVAATIREPRPIGSPVSRLVPPEGWRLDGRKGIWHQTTQLHDRQAHGRVRRPKAAGSREYPFLPALVQCPKCRTVQWLDPAHLRADQIAIPGE